MSEFIMDIERIRREARSHIEEGAITPNYQADKETILKLLGASLATEWVCVLRYTQHAIAAQGIHAEAVASEFREHAAQEQNHAMRLAERIKQLGGTPDLNPKTLCERSHAQYVQCDKIEDMIRENLIAERIAIEAYGESVRYIGDKDPTTRRLFEEILQQEEEHADDMADLLSSFGGGHQPN